KKLEILKRYFNYDNFRPGQGELIDALVSQRDAVGIMPTGGGKSLCYQVPALILDGVTLVISPLISLMKDQVEALSDAHIPAAFINSSLDINAYHEILNKALKQEYKIIYAAPERILTRGFLNFAVRLNISLIAVDEAHCVSQWGQNFRPDYLKIAQFREFLNANNIRPPIGAFTATATEIIRDDIKKLLNLNEPLCITTGFDRPNLRFEVVNIASSGKLLNLIEFIKSKHQDHSGIIYCSSRKNVERVCDELCRRGIKAVRYHAGLELEERKVNQENFIDNKIKIIVATNAFGMGIDKPDVRFVVHYNMPKDIEGYYQEAGRAGRDGLPADCLLMYDTGDIMLAKYFIAQNYERSLENEMLSDEEREFIRKRDMWRLAQIENYCKSKGCLRAYLLRYFGETPPSRCSCCGNCDKVNAFKAKLNLKLDKRDKSRAEKYSKYNQQDKIILDNNLNNNNVKDITIEAQKILSAVYRVELKFGSGLGVGAVIRLLLGSDDPSVFNLKLNEIKTYGAMRGYSENTIKNYINYLIDKGYLRLTADKYSRLLTVEEKRNAVFHGEKVEFEFEQAESEIKPSDYRSTRPPLKIFKLDDDSYDKDLFNALKKLRLKIAQDEEIAAFRIFYDSTLREMAAHKPKTLIELMKLNGVNKR
ncbi:MAG: RecQ family ATP-dependent DNA helicase, partial [Synergistaceae bacterium]|nr:RecQ family ATP-dependent DNA helicase [Synergistaceae bacterium]